MLGLKWRSLLLAGAVALTGTTLSTPSADAGWGYGYGFGYRPVVVPARVYRPAYRYSSRRYAAPRYVAPVRHLYRPVVPIAPIAVVPYHSGFGAYPNHGLYRSGYGSGFSGRGLGYGGYRSGFGGYGVGGYGVGVNVGVSRVGYFGY